MQLNRNGRASIKPNSFGKFRYGGILFIAPWLIGLLLLKLVPIAASFVYSLTDFHLPEPAQLQFVAFKNYAAIWQDFNTRPVLYRTAEVALLLIPLQIGASILFAAVLSSPKLLMKNSIRALFFLPSIIPAATFMWPGFVDPSSGWLNRLLLTALGLERLNIFAGHGAGQPLFLLGSVWMIGPGMKQNMTGTMVVLLVPVLVLLFSQRFFMQGLIITGMEKQK